jgi:hypothetical protein
VQGPQSNGALEGIEAYEQMVDTFARNAKAYWELWGPLGEPMARGVDAWAEMQRGYVMWLRQVYGTESRR